MSNDEFKSPNAGASAVADVLAGCVLKVPCAWPGMAELIEAPDEESFRALERRPGFYYYQGNKNKAAGYFIPQSVLDTGKYPGLVHGYTPEPHDVTPLGGRKLRDHQARAVTFLRLVTPQREGAILGAHMGLGKTLCSLHALWLDGLLSQPGIVCGPLSAAAAWCGPNADASRFYGMDIKRVSGKKDIDPTILASNMHVYCNYDILDAWVVWLTSSLKPAWIIFDEIHLLMHATSSRSEAAANLSRWNTIQKRVGLSGTPIPKYRMDLWNPLRCVQPRQWGNNKHQFGVHHCGGRREMASGREDEERGYYVYDGETNNHELRQRLAGTLLWYNNHDVGGVLPELTRTVRHLEPAADELVEYHEAANNIISYFKKQGQKQEDEAVSGGYNIDNVTSDVAALSKVLGDGFDLAKLSRKKNGQSAIRLRALSTMIGLLSEFKAQRAVNEVLNCLANHNHIVVFTWRRDAALHICDALRDSIDDKMLECAKNGLDLPTRMPVIFGPVDGAVKQATRQEMAQRFADTECGVYVATMGSAGIAINELSAASCALFVDLHWNPSTLTQAESRIHRDGSPHTEVDVVYLVAKDTVDELFIEHLTKKACASATIKQGDLADSRLVSDLSAMSEESAENTLDKICAALSGLGNLI